MSAEAPMYAADTLAIGPAEPLLIDEPSIGLGARLGNFVSRVGDAVHAGYEYAADHYDSLKFGAKTLAAVGGIAFVGAQAAELVTNAEPVMAGTGNTPQAVASGGLAQYCKRKMANLFPDVIPMTKSGKQLGTGIIAAGSYEQTFGILMEAKSAPQECLDAGFKLKGKATGYVGQPNHSGRPYKVGSVHYSNHEGKRQGAFPNQASVEADDYRCTKGKGKTPVFVVLDNEVLDRHGHVRAEKERRYREPVLDGHNRNAAC